MSWFFSDLGVLFKKKYPYVCLSFRSRLPILRFLLNFISSFVLSLTLLFSLQISSSIKFSFSFSVLFLRQQSALFVYIPPDICSSFPFILLYRHFISSQSWALIWFSFNLIGDYLPVFQLCLSSFLLFKLLVVVNLWLDLDICHISDGNWSCKLRSDFAIQYQNYSIRIKYLTYLILLVLFSFSFLFFSFLFFSFLFFSFLSFFSFLFFSFLYIYLLIYLFFALPCFFSLAVLYSHVSQGSWLQCRKQNPTRFSESG